MPYSSEGQITMEKTPNYLKNEIAPKELRKMNANIKLIIILRNPVKRAVSHFSHFLTNRKIYYNSSVYDNASKLFEINVLDENGEIKFPPTKIWIDSGMYVMNFRPWLNYFPLEQFLFVNGENFIKDPYTEIKKIEEYLKVPSFFKKEHFVYDKTKGYFCLNKNLDLNFVECLRSNKGRNHPFISEEVLKKLDDFYKPLNEELFDLINQKPFW